MRMASHVVVSFNLVLLGLADSGETCGGFIMRSH